MSAEGDLSLCLCNLLDMYLSDCVANAKVIVDTVKT